MTLNERPTAEREHRSGADDQRRATTEPSADGTSASPGDAGAETDPALSDDTIFFTLSNPRRRHVLRLLQECDDPVSVSDLSRAVAAWENDVAVANVTHTQYKRTYTSLYQNHLPKMDDLDILEYDRDRGIVAPVDFTDRLEFYLDACPEADRPWHAYHLGVGGVALVAAAGVALAAPPLGAGAAVTVALGWVAVAAAQTWHVRRAGEDPPATLP